MNSNSWKRRVLWAVPLIVANLLWTQFGNRLPWVQQWRRDCSHEAVQSPYCDFAVAYTLTAHPSASAIDISDDGKILVSGGKDKAIKVWDLPTGTLKKTLQSNSGEIYSVAIAPNHKTVVSGSSDRRIRIWDMTSDVPPKTLPPHTLTVKQVEISADGKTIISHSDNELKAWDLATGELQATFTLPHFLLLDINGETKTALLLSDGKIVLWNATKNQQTVLSKIPYGLRSASISRDGQTLVGIVAPQFRIARQRSARDLRIWDLTTSTLKAENRAGSGILTTALSHTHVLASTPKGIKVWNLQTADLEATLNQQQMRQLVVSADGKLLAGMISDRSHQTTKIQVLQRP